MQHADKQNAHRLGEINKRTKLGTGRFWVIDVEYQNQRGEWVGTETYTGFGYRKAARSAARSEAEPSEARKGG